jgi:hypothetical protein
MCLAQLVEKSSYVALALIVVLITQKAKISSEASCLMARGSHTTFGVLFHPLLASIFSKVWWMIGQAGSCGKTAMFSPHKKNPT